MSEKMAAADLRRFNCPACKASLGGTGYQATPEERAAVGEVQPQQGDVTVCPSCSAVLIFDGGTPRLMSVSELKAIPEKDRAFLTAIGAVMRYANERA